MGKEERSKVVLNFVWHKKGKLLGMTYIGIEGVVEGGGLKMEKFTKQGA